MQKAMNLEYRIRFWYMRKYDAISIINNSHLNEKTGSFFFIICKKTSRAIYYQRSKEMILNREKDYYRNNKER